MEKIAIYPGSFDPITKGHIDLIERSCQIFDKVIVALACNTRKSTWLTMDQRIQLLETSLSAYAQVEVLTCEGVMVNFAREKNASFIIRGIRTAADYENEFQLAGMNRQMAPEILTVFLPASNEYAFISATLVREIIALNGDISQFVPADVLILLREWQKLTL